MQSEHPPSQSQLNLCMMSVPSTWTVPTNIYSVSFAAVTAQLVNKNLSSEEIMFWSTVIDPNVVPEFVGAFLDVKADNINMSAIKDHCAKRCRTRCEDDDDHGDELLLSQSRRKKRPPVNPFFQKND